MNKPEVYRYVVTLFLMFMFMARGMNIEIPGPTMIDLKLRLNSTYHDVSRSLSARGIGCLIGAIIGGVLIDRLSRWKELILATTMGLSGITMFLIPYVGTTLILWIDFLATGLSMGVNNIAGPRMIIDLWEEKSAIPMHFVTSGNGLGAVLAALTSNPFLADLSYNTTTSNSSRTATGDSSQSNDNYTVTKPSQVQYAFMIVAIFHFSLIIPFLIFQMVSRRMKKDNRVPDEERKKTFKEIINPGTYTNGSFSYGIVMLVQIILYFFSLLACGRLFGNFVRSLSVDQMHFGKNEASYLNMVYWVFHTIGRLLGSVLAKFISVKKLFFFDILLHIIAVTSLTLFATENDTVFWVTIILYAFTFGPLLPSALAYCNTQIEMKGVVLTLISVTTGLSEMTFVWVAGHVYDAYGPRAVLYVVQGGGTGVFVMTIVMLLTSYRRPDRFKIAKNIQHGVIENNPSETTSLLKDE